MRVERQPLGDHRGSLTRLFCADDLVAAGWIWPVAQINQTLTAVRGTVRGLHYQRPPHGEAKLVSCLAGSIFDVAVDLRHGSPTFLHWHGEILSADNHAALLIPPGFAHGFQTLCDHVSLLYCHSHPHAPEAEAGVSVRDPALAISWPLEISVLSERDSAHPVMTQDFKGVYL
jgi:dTDP-4-dehydrorhamnose 3,5-epimerase